MTSLLAFVLLLQVPSDYDALVDKIKTAASNGDYSALQQCFTRNSDMEYVQRMVGPAASLRRIGVADFPAPPGYEKYGPVWVVFHRWQVPSAVTTRRNLLLRTSSGLATPFPAIAFRRPVLGRWARVP